MQWKIILLLALSLGLMSVKAQIANSDRSDEVFSRVKPTLEKELEHQNLKLGQQIFIRVFKEESELELWVRNEEDFTLFKTYPICDFSGQPGPKLREGDGQSPEGFYYITDKSFNPWSSFHLSMNINYPNAYDRFHSRTGSFIMIHGACVSIGCYAMTDEFIEEIYMLAHESVRQTGDIVRVHIFPYRMTDVRHTESVSDPNYDFWTNLKQGYDYFEEHKEPPNTIVSGGNYVFQPI